MKFKSGEKVIIKDKPELVGTIAEESLSDTSAYVIVNIYGQGYRYHESDLREFCNPNSLMKNIL